jgi:hypothetical protein
VSTYVVVYFPHGGTIMPEANGPYRSLARAEAEVERLAALEVEVDAYVGWTPVVVELGVPVQSELHPAFWIEE